MLPWFFGTAVVVALARRDALAEPGEVAWSLGMGYLVGAFAITLWMRLLSAIHVDFGIVSIGGPVLALALGLWIWRFRRSGPTLRSAIRTAFDVLRARELGLPEGDLSTLEEQ